MTTRGMKALTSQWLISKIVRTQRTQWLHYKKRPTPTLMPLWAPLPKNRNNLITFSPQKLAKRQHIWQLFRNKKKIMAIILTDSWVLWIVIIFPKDIPPRALHSVIITIRWERLLSWVNKYLHPSSFCSRSIWLVKNSNKSSRSFFYEW